MNRIGEIARLRRYPVKSMRGEDLTEAQVESYGLLGDRIYAYVLDDAPNPRFPWMTARQAAEMLLYIPTYLPGDEIQVQSPDGKKYSITNGELEERLEAKYGCQISLKHRESGCHDSKAISVLGLQSIRKLHEETGIDELAPERFRANIYVSWDADEPFLEDELIGREVQIGEREVRLKIVKKDSRCIIPTLDPSTTQAFPEILETIKSNHGGCFGVYAEVASKGKISKGDPITLC